MNQKQNMSGLQKQLQQGQNFLMEWLWVEN